MPGMGGPMMGGAMAPHAPFGIDPITGMPFSDKSKMVAGLLQIFLGSFGVGRFYTGHIGLGILKLVTCGGLGVWWIIDFVLIAMRKLPDADGRPLR